MRSRNPFVSTLPVLGSHPCTTAPGFEVGVGSLCLHGKHFTNWTIVPSLAFTFLISKMMPLRQIPPELNFLHVLWSRVKFWIISWNYTNFLCSAWDSVSLDILLCLQIQLICFLYHICKQSLRLQLVEKRRQYFLLYCYRLPVWVSVVSSQCCQIIPWFPENCFLINFIIDHNILELEGPWIFF